MTHVLVTGGCGFIGSHLVDALLDRGDRVTVVDNLSTGRREHLRAGTPFVEADVADAEALGAVFARERFDAVCHIAGQASISRSFTHPERDLATNVQGTLNVLDGCISNGVPRLVFASSMTAYGEPEEVPTPESAPCRPVSYYGVTKYAAERYVQIADERRDVDLAVTSLRMFNVFGERQSLDNPYQGVLAIFIGNVLRGEPVTIHSDGLQTRDFVYVRDVVAAWLAVLDEPRTAGEVYNVGSGRETTINDLADAVLAAFGHSRSSWDVRSGMAQEGDLRRSGASIDRLRAAVGWEPGVALEDGMRRTIDWART